MRPWHILTGIFAIGLSALGYYTLSPLFITLKKDDALPIIQESLPQTATSSTSLQTEAVPIIDTPLHPAQGTVRIISNGNTQYVRYENFETINGPDIFVYLAKDLEAVEFVSLGRVTATKGNVNYPIPEGVDPREYPYVLIWCKAFGVLFNSAKVY